MSGAFLNVAASISGRVWVDRLGPAGARAAAVIVQRLGVEEIVARILAGRGVGVEAVESYLNPTLRDLMPDPAGLADMERLAERLAEAIARRENVALLSDYDVDGACAAALVTRYLRHFGLTPTIYIPDRIFEGYGPNVAALDTLIDAGATLIVLLDCGTVSEGPIAHAKARGVDVLVIDHHLPDRALPPADALVNPNRADDFSGLGALCAAGVAFMALVAINRRQRAAGMDDLPDLLTLLDLVALATICDVVPLLGLNRAFVVRGLEVARRAPKSGIAALAAAARVGGPFNAYHLGFLIGPRINAGGRIGDAALGARLLTLDDEVEAARIAAQLDALNVERQRIEREAVEEAGHAAEIEIGAGEGPPILVLASANWHPGVIGIVAGRLRERFERPVFVIALLPDGSGIGSGRSVSGVDLGRAVLGAVAAGVIAKGGGHAMAAGATLPPGQTGAFRAHLDAALAADIAAARLAKSLPIDAALAARGATPDLVAQVDRAGPFGAGNPQPLFAFPGHQVKFAEIVGAGHVRLTLVSGDGARVGAIAFRAAGTPLGQALLGATAPLHVAGHLSLDHYQGRARVQLRVVDAAVPT